MIQTIANVLRDGQVRKQRVILRDKTDVSSLRRCKNISVFLEPDFVVETNFARVRFFEAGEAAQNRRLAGAGRTEQHGDILSGLKLIYADFRTAGKLFGEVRAQAVHVFLLRNIPHASSAANASVADTPASHHA